MKSYQKVTIQLVREQVKEYPQIKSAKDIYELATRIVNNDPREYFLAFYFNVKNRIIGVHVVSIGTMVESLVHPREVFQPGIILGAHALIIAHNHPSGDLIPSPEDIKVTNRLKGAAEILGIELLDHIIFTDKSYFSFAERNVNFA